MLFFPIGISRAGEKKLVSVASVPSVVKKKLNYGEHGAEAFLWWRETASTKCSRPRSLRPAVKFIFSRSVSPEQEKELSLCDLGALGGKKKNHAEV